MTDAEIWREIDNFPDYEVSTNGRVRRAKAPTSKSANKNVVGKVLKPGRDGKGGLHVSLCIAGGSHHTQQIAPLVMARFGPPPPYSRSQIAFADGNSENCAIANLKWVERYSLLERPKWPMTSERRERLNQVHHAAQGRYRERNREKLREEGRARARRDYRRDPEKFRAASKQWAAKNKEAVSQFRRDYWQRNKQKMCTAQRERMHADIRFRVKSRMGTQVARRLRRRLSGKGNNLSFELLGYTVDQLMVHLQEQFQPGMSWENYGQWHIDHRIPDSHFEYSCPADEGFQRSWALSNLQPLWRLDNIRKGARLDWVTK